MENRILANDENLLTETLIFEMGRGVPRYSKLTLAEAFDIATIYNALGSSLQAGAARRIYGLPPLPPSSSGIVRLGRRRAVGEGVPVLGESGLPRRYHEPI